MSSKSLINLICSVIIISEIPRSVVNYCRLLSLQAINNEHYKFVSLAKYMNIFLCFSIIWLIGWSFSKNYRNVPSFELFRKGSYSSRESVLQCL